MSTVGFVTKFTRKDISYIFFSYLLTLIDVSRISIVSEKNGLVLFLILYNSSFILEHSLLELISAGPIFFVTRRRYINKSSV
jgi:hypothetical protein